MWQDESDGCRSPKATHVELVVEPMLEAFSTATQLGEVFGPLLALAVKNDESNGDKVRAAWGTLGADDPGRVASLRGLLEAERATGIHKAGGVLADPSAAIALLWMRRTLTFTNALLEGTLSAGATGNMVNVAKEAYKTHLEAFHSWWLKNTFRVGLNGMPNREDLFQVWRLAPGTRKLYIYLHPHPKPHPNPVRSASHPT